MISGLVLKWRKDIGLDMAKWLNPLSMSGKVVYSGSAKKRIEIVDIHAHPSRRF